MNTSAMTPDTGAESGLKTPTADATVQYCPKCAGTMINSTAIVGAPRGITYEGEWSKKLVDCLKCENCGHSEKTLASKVHFVVPKA